MLAHVGRQDPEGLRVFYYLVQDAISCICRAGMTHGENW